MMRSSGEDKATAFFSSKPGGSAEMVNLALRNGAQLSRVAAAQSLRVVIVVLTVPASFKFFLGNGSTTHHVAEVNWYWLLWLFPVGGLAAWVLQPLNACVVGTLGYRQKATAGACAFSWGASITVVGRDEGSKL
ncbi:putative ammonia monooxygenase [compost metagenome]